MTSPNIDFCTQNMVAFNPDDTSRFANFTILTTAYKTFHNNAISVDILYPNPVPALSTTGLPIIIRFHGGGFVTGSSLFPDFFGRWLLELAREHSAIIVSPNHRLLPESSVADILDDVEDLWTWMHKSLPVYLEEKSGGVVKADLARIMTTGDSAGGYLSLQLGLDHPKEIRAVTAAYPMLDLKSPQFVDKYEKQVFGMPQLPETTLPDHLAKARSRTTTSFGSEISGKEGSQIVSSDPRLERAPLMFSMIQQGLYGEYFDLEKRKLFPLDRLEDGDRFPRGGGFVWHGREDSVVPVEGSEKLKRILAKVDPRLAFTLAVRPGDHGFDGETKIADDWFAGGMKPVLEAWLASS